MECCRSGGLDSVEFVIVYYLQKSITVIDCRRGDKKMDINQLEYFRTVAKMQNVTRAAESLYITQPNLSMSLTKLENELGIKLFKRKKGSVALTSKGEVFLYYVNKALGELHSGLDYIAERSGRFDAY